MAKENYMLRTAVLTASFIIAPALTSMALANPPVFQLDKIGDACPWTDNASYRNCLGSAVAKLTAKMKGNILCGKDTCIIRLRCSAKSKTCSNDGFLVQYGVAEAGSTIKIRLASGKTADYFRCGTCSGVEPVDDDQIPLRLMESEKSVILEIPASENVQ